MSSKARNSLSTIPIRTFSLRSCIILWPPTPNPLPQCITASFSYRQHTFCNSAWSSFKMTTTARTVQSAQLVHPYNTFQPTLYSSILAILLLLLVPIQSQIIALSSEEQEKKVIKENDIIDENCPFCRYFTQSPCKEPFLIWQRCVQKNEDATNCMEEFHPLGKCMKEHNLMDERGEKKEDKKENETKE